MATSNSFFTRYNRLSYLQANDLRFDRLFRDHYPALTFLAQRMMSDGAAGQKIVLEAFSLLWKKSSGFKNEKEVRLFLYTTIWTACLKLRSRDMKRSYSTDTLTVADKQHRFFIQAELYRRLPADLSNRDFLIPLHH